MTTRRRFLGLLGLAAVAPVAIKLAKLVPAAPIADAVKIDQLTGSAILARQRIAEAEFASVLNFRAQARARMAEHLARQIDEMVFKNMYIEAGYINAAP